MRCAGGLFVRNPSAQTSALQWRLRSRIILAALIIAITAPYRTRGFCLGGCGRGPE